ncbi:MAG: DUF11 domain-containing protein [Nitriliruptorales bacterium]|nr:DUF11 domain-containing protein [Nitriliruptorales bacterium]
MKRARTIVAIATAALLGGGLAVLPASAEVTGDFKAGADADLIEVSAVGLPPFCGDEGLPVLSDALACDFELAQLVLGDSEAAVDSNNGLSHSGDDNLSAFGHGSNLDLDALTVGGTEGSIPLDLIQEATAKQPGGDASSEPDPIEIPADPLLHVDLATVSAHAVDVGAGNNTCPIAGQDELRVADGRSELAGVAVLPDAMGEGMDIVGITDPEGVSFAESAVDLVNGLGVLDPGQWGIRSTARVRTTPVSLFGGALELQIGDPSLVVEHDGDTLTATYNEPIVTINGETVIDGELLDPLDEDLVDAILDPLNDALAGVLEVQVNIADQNDVVVDGTTVTVTDLVEVRVVLGDTLEVLSLSIGDLSAAAEVPAGGITFTGCDDNPLELHKTLSASDVTPGETFDYTITIANRDDTCTLTDILVTDVVTGPAGTTVEVSDDSPQPDTVDGLTLTWNDVGPLEPNESVTIRIHVTAPDDASAGDRFSDTVTVTANCDGEPFDNDDFVDGPVVFDGDAPDGCFLGDSNKTATHIEVTPGAVFSYLVNVFNSGDETCTDVTVVDTLPDGFGFVSCSPACTEDSGVVTFAVGDLGPGASQTLAITVTAPDSEGQWINVATIDAPNNSGDPVDVSTDCPLVEDEIILKPPDPADRTTGMALPRTGGGAALFGLAGLLAGAAIWRRQLG